MPSTSHENQFDKIFSQRVNALSGHRRFPEERWRIWLQQDREEGRACFATCQRDTCRKHKCQWRATCTGLRAEWRR